MRTPAFTLGAEVETLAAGGPMLDDGRPTPTADNEEPFPGDFSDDKGPYRPYTVAIADLVKTSETLAHGPGTFRDTGQQKQRRALYSVRGATISLFRGGKSASTSA